MANRELIKYDASLAYRSPLAEDAACAACGSQILLVRDHCHEHGWVRDIVCIRCNGYLAFIDRGRAPGVPDEILAALVTVRNLCPDCGLLDAASLWRRDSPPEAVKPPLTFSEERKAHENRLRRAAARQGLVFARVRRRTSLAASTYRIESADGTELTASLALDDVDYWLMHPDRRS